MPQHDTLQEAHDTCPNGKPCLYQCRSWIDCRDPEDIPQPVGLSSPEYDEDDGTRYLREARREVALANATDLVVAMFRVPGSVILINNKPAASMADAVLHAARKFEGYLRDG